jgi:hypothetical protein
MQRTPLPTVGSAVFVPVCIPNCRDFERDIRPVLQEQVRWNVMVPKNKRANCASMQKLMHSKAAAKGLCFLLGKPSESPLFKRLISTDEQERMPPKGEALSPEQISKFREWDSKRGSLARSRSDRKAAVDPRLQHWAYRPLRSFDVERNVDTFIEDGLTAQELAFFSGSKPSHSHPPCFSGHHRFATVSRGDRIIRF